MEEIKFGKYNGRDANYLAKIIEGYLTVICWGGTAYAIKIETEQEALDKLNPILESDERGVIEYCSKNNWLAFDYYGYKLYKNSEVVHEFSEEVKPKEWIERLKKK